MCIVDPQLNKLDPDLCRLPLEARILLLLVCRLALEARDLFQVILRVPSQRLLVLKVFPLLLLMAKSLLLLLPQLL